MLHQDFHPGNVLAAQREPWLVIDPKPVSGDPAFDTVQLVMEGGDPSDHGAVTRRIAALAALLDLEPERIRAWVHARAVEWALWDLTVGEPAEARDTLRWAEAVTQRRA